MLAALWTVSAIAVLLSYLIPLVGPYPPWSRDGKLGEWFWVDQEGNFPTWWSGSVLVTAGVLHLAATWIARRTRARAVLAWAVLATLALMMSLDEVAQLHEYGNTRLGAAGATLFLSYPWLVFGIPLGVAAIAVVVVSAIRLPRVTRVLEVVAIGLFFLGAVGLEAVGDAVLSRGLGASVLEVVQHLEEGVEMLGSSLMVVAPLAALNVCVGDGRLAVVMRG